MGYSRPGYEDLNLEDLIRSYKKLKKVSKAKSDKIERLNEEQMNLRSDFEGLKIDLLKLETQLSARQDAKLLAENKRLAELTKTIKSLKEKNKLYEKINEDLEGISERKNEKIIDLEKKENQLLKYSQAALAAMTQAEVIILLGKVETLNEKKQAIMDELDEDCDFMETQTETMEGRVDLLREEVEDLVAKDKAEGQPVVGGKSPQLAKLEKDVHELTEEFILLQSANRRLAKTIAAQDKRIVNFTGPLSVAIKEKGLQRSPSSLASTMYKNASVFTEQLSKANKQRIDLEEVKKTDSRIRIAARRKSS